MSLLSSSVATLGLFVSNPPVASGLTIAGVAIYGVSKIYQAASVRELSVPEQIYRDYFCRNYSAAERVGNIQKNNAKKQFDRAFDGHPEAVVPGAVPGDGSGSAQNKTNFVRRFYYDLSSDDTRLTRHDTGNIKRIPDLSDDENDLIKRYIEKTGGLPGSDPRYKTDIPAEWAYTLKILYKICEKHPERLSGLILALYGNYSDTCWQMSEQQYAEFMKEVIEDRNYTESALRLPSKEQKKDYSDNMEAEMMGSHSELIFELTASAERKAKEEAERLIETDLLPKLNMLMEFRVDDETLNDPKEFSKSVYGADYRIDKDNPGISNYYEVDFSKVETPMAFGIKRDGGFAPVDKPRFVPREGVVNIDGRGDESLSIRKGDEDRYFPYTDNFLPRAVPGDNLVFTCIYYHYLMMGAPTAIIFHKMGEKDDYKPVAFALPEAPDADGVMRVNIKAPKVSDTSQKVVYVFDHQKGYDEDDELTYTMPEAWELYRLVVKCLNNAELIQEADGSFTLSASGTDNSDKTYTDETYDNGKVKMSANQELVYFRINGASVLFPKTKNTPISLRIPRELCRAALQPKLRQNAVIIRKQNRPARSGNRDCIIKP